MKYRKILLAYNGSQEGKRALLECADLASFLGAETHLLAVASMPPSLFLTEGFVPEELLEEEKKRTQAVLDEGIRTLRERGFNATGQLAVGEPVEEICRLREEPRRRPDRRRPQPALLVRGALVEGLGRRDAPRLRALQHPRSPSRRSEMLKGRLEDDRMLTGRGKYVSDWNLPGQAYGHFLRSDRAHAEIVSHRRGRCLAHPGVLAVITGEDIRAALKSLPLRAAGEGPRRHGAASIPAPGARAGARALTGEPVALVVAESAAAGAGRGGARDRRLRDLPAVMTARAGHRAGRAAACTTACRATWCMDFESGDEAATNAAFAKAAQRGRSSTSTSRAWSATRWSRARASRAFVRRGQVPSLHLHAGRGHHAQPALRGARRAAREDPRRRRGSRRRLRRALQRLSRNTAPRSSRRRSSAAR